ncbi:MAG: MBL fold metallo-hydrolase [Nakamurella sp.]
MTTTTALDTTRPTNATPTTSALTVTRIGHSCHLLEIGGLRLLTDPWFTFTPTYDPGEPVRTTIDALPDLDGVLITHEHYDHCDLDAFAAYRDLDVPVIAPGTVVERAFAAGFTDVRRLEAWDATTIGPVTITATPGEHGVHEVTYVIEGEGRTVFFGGDTLYIPELDRLPERFGHFDLALLPTNGLCVRPMNGRQMVMNAIEAAELVAVLHPDVAIPHHYAFTSGRLGDRMITDTDSEPLRFAEAVARLAPDTVVRVVLPGVPVTIEADDGTPRFRPEIDAEWSAGQRPMIADLRSRAGHEDELRVAVM